MGEKLWLEPVGGTGWGEKLWLEPVGGTRMG